MVDPDTEFREFQERSQTTSATERREEESPADRQRAQLQQDQRLESLGHLADGIAHDFNNLLAVILGYASFVSAELAVPSGSDWPKRRLESARRDLEQITLAAERASSLTRQLLASVRQEVVRPQVLDLGHGVAGVQEMLRRTLGDHTGLVTTLAVDLWPALADPGQQAILGAITLGAGGYVPKQTSAADLVGAGRKVAYGQSMLDPYAARQVMTLRDRMASEDPVAALTRQEKRVLELIGEGLTNRQIADRMELAEKTAKNYVSSLLAKLGMHRRTEAAAFSVRHPSGHYDLTLTAGRRGEGRRCDLCRGGCHPRSRRVIEPGPPTGRAKCTGLQRGTRLEYPVGPGRCGSNGLGPMAWVQWPGSNENKNEGRLTPFRSS
jgi:DNA-binding CsgD family transcriptional regulator